MAGQKREFDVSAYLVIGPENTLGRPVEEIIKAAVSKGFSFVQLRSKVTEARDLITLSAATDRVLTEIGKRQEVTFVINDRLDVVLAAREQGIKVDGIHVGQQDIPPEICRKYLGNDAVIGLSAPTEDLLSYVQNIKLPDIDYLGAGPLHPTLTKKDCGLQLDGRIITRSLAELTELAKISPWPVVVGGGVKLNDLPALATTGVDGFFVVSAVTEATDTLRVAEELVSCWKNSTHIK